LFGSFEAEPDGYVGKQKSVLDKLRELSKKAQ
jgi:hypothetical protein